MSLIELLLVCAGIGLAYRGIQYLIKRAKRAKRAKSIL
jgi:hypothetical protein